ncbi:MAG: hypothetical protein M3250_10465 [Thermoproteota archaeon]|nr:hypothetical protein [Thermoproteota archaeon]
MSINMMKGNSRHKSVANSYRFKFAKEDGKFIIPTTSLLDGFCHSYGIPPAIYDNLNNNTILINTAKGGNKHTSGGIVESSENYSTRTSSSTK